MTSIEYILGDSHNACPNCNSKDWKSAKMVVMEGTRTTNGSLGGKVTDPGALSGGIKNILLSDRWFSWDYPIEADIELTSQSGLVEEIRQMMAAHSTKLKMPDEPAEPKKIGFFEKINPVEPKQSIMPEKPEKVEHKSFMEKLNNLFSLIIISLVVFVFFWFTFNEKIGFLISVPLLLIGTIGIFEDKEKNLNEKYDKEMDGYPDRQQKYLDDIKDYETLLEKANIQKINEEKEQNHYKQQLKEYESKKNEVMNARELLWDRTRVCIRCGNVYLGQVS